MKVFAILLNGLVFSLVTLVSTFAQERQSASSDSRQAILGNWEWTVSMGPIKKHLQMEVSEKDGKLVAWVKAQDEAKIEAEEFEVKEDRVRFSVTRSEGSMTMTIAHDGKLKGEKIVGEAKTRGGPFDTPLKWNASRVRPKPGPRK